MEFKQIKELIKLIDNTNISEVQLEEDDFKITIRTNDYASLVQPKIVPVHSQVQAAPMQAQPVAQPQVTAAPVTAPAAPKAEATEEEDDMSKYLTVKSPMVGTFYRSSSPDKPPFVKVGDDISADSVVCIVEAMKLFNEIEAEVTGKIVKVLVENASPVEYDQPLFLVDPNA